MCYLAYPISIAYVPYQLPSCPVDEPKSPPQFGGQNSVERAVCVLRPIRSVSYKKLLTDASVNFNVCQANYLPFAMRGARAKIIDI